MNDQGQPTARTSPASEPRAEDALRKRRAARKANGAIGYKSQEILGTKTDGDTRVIPANKIRKAIRQSEDAQVRDNDRVEASVKEKPAKVLPDWTAAPKIAWAEPVKRKPDHSDSPRWIAPETSARVRDLTAEKARRHQEELEKARLAAEAETIAPQATVIESPAEEAVQDEVVEPETLAPEVTADVAASAGADEAAQGVADEAEVPAPEIADDIFGDLSEDGELGTIYDDSASQEEITDVPLDDLDEDERLNLIGDTEEGIESFLHLDQGPEENLDLAADLEIAEIETPLPDLTADAEADDELLDFEDEFDFDLSAPDDSNTIDDEALTSVMDESDPLAETETILETPAIGLDDSEFAAAETEEELEDFDAWNEVADGEITGGDLADDEGSGLFAEATDADPLYEAETIEEGPTLQIDESEFATAEVHDDLLDFEDEDEYIDFDGEEDLFAEEADSSEGLFISEPDSDPLYEGETIEEGPALQINESEFATEEVHDELLDFDDEEELDFDDEEDFDEDTLSADLSAATEDLFAREQAEEADLLTEEAGDSDGLFISEPDTDPLFEAETTQEGPALQINESEFAAEEVHDDLIDFGEEEDIDFDDEEDLFTEEPSDSSGLFVSEADTDPLFEAETIEEGPALQINESEFAAEEVHDELIDFEEEDAFDFADEDDFDFDDEEELDFDEDEETLFDEEDSLTADAAEPSLAEADDELFTSEELNAYLDEVDAEDDFAYDLSPSDEDETAGDTIAFSPDDPLYEAETLVETPSLQINDSEFAAGETHDELLDLDDEEAYIDFADEDGLFDDDLFIDDTPTSRDGDNLATINDTEELDAEEDFYEDDFFSEEEDQDIAFSPDDPLYEAETLVETPSLQINDSEFAAETVHDELIDYGDNADWLDEDEAGVAEDGQKDDDVYYEDISTEAYDEFFSDSDELEAEEETLSAIAHAPTRKEKALARETGDAAVAAKAFDYSAISKQVIFFIVAMSAFGVFVMLASNSFIRIDYILMVAFVAALLLTLVLSFSTAFILAIVLVAGCLLGFIFTHFFTGSSLGLHHIFWPFIIPAGILSAAALIKKIKDLIEANKSLLAMQTEGGGRADAQTAEADLPGAYQMGIDDYEAAAFYDPAAEDANELAEAGDDDTFLYPEDSDETYNSTMIDVEELYEISDGDEDEEWYDDTEVIVENNYVVGEQTISSTEVYDAIVAAEDQRNTQEEIGAVQEPLADFPFEGDEPHDLEDSYPDDWEGDDELEDK